ncbi:uracil-DNA glycosylase [Proteocatella sphenisci]|uniref:uracil-DNA glycosylase n=1 Tax=Proteocatella sphenisci TaxID=181070 RepID=UPI0004AD2B7A|nr:uracil-DNA glycosylase [Proteocatella sphenisci]
MDNLNKSIIESFALYDLKPVWKKIIYEEFNEPYFSDMMNYLDKEYKTTTIFPPKENIFEIFKRVDMDDVKVVLIGQDPYHGDNQANGMCFSVNSKVKNPPSLVNIFKELENEFGKVRILGDLTDWVDQGVLLLNSILTVEKSRPGSHKNIGWEKFTNKIIYSLNLRENPLVFVLWGKYAIEKASIVDKNKHYVLTSSHPSPFSCHKGFLGNNHFKMVNEYLMKKGKSEIVWI